MIILNVDNTVEDFKPIEVSISEIYYTLLNESNSTIQTLISWLPNISNIEVFTGILNYWLDIKFTNGEEIRLYNTGVENLLYDLVEKNNK